MGMVGRECPNNSAELGATLGLVLILGISRLGFPTISSSSVLSEASLLRRTGPKMSESSSTVSVEGCKTSLQVDGWLWLAVLWLEGSVCWLFLFVEKLEVMASPILPWLDWQLESSNSDNGFDFRRVI